MRGTYGAWEGVSTMGGWLGAAAAEGWVEKYLPTKNDNLIVKFKYIYITPTTSQKITWVTAEDPAEPEDLFWNGTNSTSAIKRN